MGVEIGDSDRGCGHVEGPSDRRDPQWLPPADAAEHQ